jgi:hypothetical protein
MFSIIFKHFLVKKIFFFVFLIGLTPSTQTNSQSSIMKTAQKWLFWKNFFFYPFSKFGKPKTCFLSLLTSVFRKEKKMFLYVFDRTYTTHTYEKTKFSNENSPKIIFFENFSLNDFHKLANSNLIFHCFWAFLGNKFFLCFC